MNNTELIARANAKADYLKDRSWFDEVDLLHELVDALEAAQPKDPCGTCGEQVNYYRSGCPGCSAPVCCEACCRANQKSDALRGEIAYQLTKRLVIDMPTARAAVDSAFNASTGAAQPAPQVPMTEKEALQLWNYEASKSGYNVHELPARYTRAIEAHHGIGVKP